MIDPAGVDDVLARAAGDRPRPLPAGFADAVTHRLAEPATGAPASGPRLAALLAVAVVAAGATAFVARPAADAPPPLTGFDSPAPAPDFMNR